jgi:uncharacterized phage-associated protein
MKFSEEKTVEVAAFFLSKCSNSLTIKKLMKLMYLAERQSITDYGELLVGDNPVSLPQGPVLSRTYDIAKANSNNALWNKHIARNGMLVELNKGVENRHLSRADFKVLDKTWNTFGHLSPQELTDLTHNECEEWSDPCGSSHPIEYWEFAKAVGYDDEASTNIGKRIIEQRKLSISIEALSEAL